MFQNIVFLLPKKLLIIILKSHSLTSIISHEFRRFGIYRTA